MNTEYVSGALNGNIITRVPYTVPYAQQNGDALQAQINTLKIENNVQRANLDMVMAEHFALQRRVAELENLVKMLAAEVLGIDTKE